MHEDEHEQMGTIVSCALGHLLTLRHEIGMAASTMLANLGFLMKTCSRAGSCTGALKRLMLARSHLTAIHVSRSNRASCCSR